MRKVPLDSDAVQDFTPPEEFQRRLEQALEGLEGVKPIFDDILIFGVGETQAEALADHDAKLRALFER